MENLEVTVKRGDSWSGLKVRWLQADGTTPVVIASARMQIRRNVEDTVMLELTSPSGGIAIDASQWITPAITPVQSAALSDGVYDLQATSDGGEVKTLVGGVLKVETDVTR